MDELFSEKKLDRRSAGILMHITSLPGPAFIGDLGPASTEFAEFLHSAKQSVWQMLPLQPTGAEQSFSPYSAASAFAGNPLLISPQILAREGWINTADLKRSSSADGRVNYLKAQLYKEPLLVKAWKTWKKKAPSAARIAFTEFCVKEKHWLDDYALYSVIKKQNKNLPWYKWPLALRDRDPEALEKIALKYVEDLDCMKWIQMIFDQQRSSLHKLCDSLQVRLLGDVPIYVAHDSADVWSHRDLFTLDENGNLTEVAGVPPDLFNSNGQLWGMPLFKWDVVKQKQYDWWIKRLRKNLAWFDIVRLDHFRGFSSYWSVPAAAKTAKEGSWLPGPAESMFEKLKEEFGGLPFVAEDLGEIDKPVYQLRDAFDLPGMNVLHFAFGDDMPKSSYLPHNYNRNSIVYTGTHDNNTTVGWFKDASKTIKQNLSGYTGVKINNRNVAEQLIKLAYMSVSNLAIVPMQDLLSLDGSARMNMPATSEGNWSWRLKKNQINQSLIDQLRNWCNYYDRDNSV